MTRQLLKDRRRCGIGPEAVFVIKWWLISSAGCFISLIFAFLIPKFARLLAGTSIGGLFAISAFAATKGYFGVMDILLIVAVPMLLGFIAWVVGGRKAL